MYNTYMTAVYIWDYFIWFANNIVTQTHVVVLKVHYIKHKTLNPQKFGFVVSI